MREKPEVLFTESEISQRVADIAGEVTRVYEGRELCVVGIMKSCLVFMADLIRKVPLDVTCHFLRSSSLRGGEGGSVRSDIVYSTEIPYEGRDILLLCDVIDTGITLNFLLDHIREHAPRTLKVCAIIDKPWERKIDVHPDWALFTLKEALVGGRFIVGYGLDHGDNYRGLPYIGAIPRPESAAEGRKITLSPES
jgi:hypoxanthine phosphoribosyltransferase